MNESTPKANERHGPGLRTCGNGHDPFDDVPSYGQWLRGSIRVGGTADVACGLPRPSVDSLERMLGAVARGALSSFDLDRSVVDAGTFPKQPLHGAQQVTPRTVGGPQQPRSSPKPVLTSPTIARCATRMTAAERGDRRTTLPARAGYAKSRDAVPERRGDLLHHPQRDPFHRHAGGGGDDPSEDEDSWKLVHFIRHLPELSARELAEMKCSPTSASFSPVSR